MKSKYAELTTPTIQEIKCYKCPCGKVWNYQERAAECCGNKLCTQCGENQWEYSYEMICGNCKEENAQEYWQKSGKKEWMEFSSPYVYSDLLNEYLDEEDVYRHYEEDFGEDWENVDWQKAAETYRLYVCEPIKPRKIDLLNHWAEYGPSDPFEDFEYPEGWEKVEETYNNYLENCGPFSYIDTQYGLKV